MKKTALTSIVWKDYGSDYSISIFLTIDNVSIFLDEFILLRQIGKAIFYFENGSIIEATTDKKLKRSQYSELNFESKKIKMCFSSRAVDFIIDYLSEYISSKGHRLANHIDVDFEKDKRASLQLIICVDK